VEAVPAVLLRRETLDDAAALLFADEREPWRCEVTALLLSAATTALRLYEAALLPLRVVCTLPLALLPLTCWICGRRFVALRLALNVDDGEDDDDRLTSVVRRP
jgi:hypothetical protein